MNYITGAIITGFICIILCNHENIRSGTTNWLGMSSEQSKGGFVRFQNSVFGYRAMAKVLLTHQSKHRLNSVTDMITRYAPPSENPTQAYIDFVVKETGFTSWSGLNLKNEEVMFLLIKAMAKFEQGKKFHDSDDTIRAGIKLALEDE